MAMNAFLGTWEILAYDYINGSFSENHTLEGVKFRLDENGDVTWEIHDDLKSIPLFSCETYEIYSTSVLGVSLMFGEYAGHVLELKSDQKEPKDSVILTCEGWCILHCKRIYDNFDDSSYSVPFSLLPALEEGYFSDLVLTSANNKQFNVHSTILKLQAPDVDWSFENCPFKNEPEEVLLTILHFLYAECLPDSLTEATARQIISIILPYQSLNKLHDVCVLYLKNMALKQQIIGLVTDMHSCMNKMIDHFTVKNNATESLTSNPSQLCLVVKQCIRDGAVAIVKLLLLCDIFTQRKDELTRDERHEIIRYAKSRFPIFLTQQQRFLQVLKNTFSSLNASQRTEIAAFLVPEIEIVLEMISTLIVQVENALEQIIQVLAPNECSKNKQGVGDMLGRSLKNLLHIKELTKLRNFHEQVTCSLGLLIHKRQSFNEMSAGQKIRSISRNLEQLIEELPIFLIRLEEVTVASDEKLEWRDFKFCFKVGTSKVSGILQKLVAHRETLQEVLNQLCELVQRDSFNQSLHSMGLLESSNTNLSPEMSKISRSSSYSSLGHHSYKLNLVESLCVPPTSKTSLLSKMSLELLRSGVSTDMEFEVISNQDGDEADVSQSIKAHRVIVATRCDWFRRALQSGMKEDIHKKITIHDTNVQLFQIFLEYLYSGRLRQNKLSSEQLVDLLLLGDRYEVDSLKLTCEYSLEHCIDTDNAIYLLSLSDQYNALILKNSCLDFLSQHTELTETDVFYELPLSLQAEVFDLVWMDPFQRKKISRKPKKIDFATEFHSMSLDDSPLEEAPSEDATRLNSSIIQMRDIVGDIATREQLVEVILAADYDLCRAINYFYARHSDSA